MTTTERDLRADWQTWHDEREALLREPHGWLSLTALEWLDAESRTIPGLPGTWRVRDADTVEIAASAADGVRLPDSDAPVDGVAELRPVDGLPGVMVTVGDKAVEIARRTDSYALRVRDPQAPTRTAFDGVPVWPVDERWVRPGRFTPYPEPERITVGAVVDGLHHYPTAIGTVTFDVDGEPQELVALTSSHGGPVLHFRDATSGNGSYGGGRILVVFPEPDGSVTVDLNRTTNLPCAFTAFATCPLPPEGNRLPVAVDAGEKNPT